MSGMIAVNADALVTVGQWRAIQKQDWTVDARATGNN